MNGLILHTGTASVSREVIALTPTPERTRSHVPIPHLALIEHVQGTLTGAGMEVVEEAHGLTKDGNRHFGLFGLRETGSNHPDFQLTVGLRNPRTAWSLFNAFTEALKGNIGEFPRRTQALHGLMDLECGLAV
jgi:hypothetical protein